jgi:glycosyltransferase involved in cell wall biosynthesis
VTAAARTLSVVIPAYNEVESLPILVRHLVGVLDALPGVAWQVVLVDDGSRDGTTAVMSELAREHDGIRAVLLRTNFGKSAALMAGFREATGETVITMDADLQDDPDEIPAFLAKLDQGFDLVSGWKRERNDPLEKRLPSRFFNFVVRKVSGVKLHDNNCGFKAYRRWCIESLELRGNQHRFIPAMLASSGARIGEIPVHHHARRFGSTKFGASRYFHGAFDLTTLILLTRFSQNPLYLFGIIGLPLIVLGGSIGAWLLASHLLWLVFETVGHPLTARPLLILASFCVLTGILMILIGLIAEMVLRASPKRGYYVASVIGSGPAFRPAGGAREGTAGEPASEPLGLPDRAR